MPLRMLRMGMGLGAGMRPISASAASATTNTVGAAAATSTALAIGAVVMATVGAAAATSGAAATGTAITNTAGAAAATSGAAGVYEWSPFDLGADLLAFWDAETLASITLAGSLVTSWADRVAGYAAVQATSGFRPAYSATSLNNRPGVTFDGTDDNLRTAALPATFPVGSVGSELWGLASQDFAGTQSGNQTIVSYGDTGNLNCRRIYRVNTSNVNRGAVAAVSVATDTTIDLSGIHIVRGMVAPTAISVAVDGDAATTTAVVPATASSGTVSLGSLTGGTNRFWKGPLNAVLVTNPLSAPNAALLLAFLKARGGLP